MQEKLIAAEKETLSVSFRLSEPFLFRLFVTRAQTTLCRSGYRFPVGSPSPLPLQWLPGCCMGFFASACTVPFRPNCHVVLVFFCPFVSLLTTPMVSFDVFFSSLLLHEPSPGHGNQE